jgi:tetratricopeptide (TPR) repeat protein
MTKLLTSVVLILSTLIVFVPVLLTQSPREQLNQLVVQLRSNPSDNALRERTIKLAQEIKPPPAVPEEAERRMARGSAAFKAAKNENDFKEAVREFEQAALAAPWLGDVYYNLGVAQDKAGDHASAVRSLKLALLAAPDSRDTKSLLYEVEYRLEKVNSPEAQAAKKREQDLAQDEAFARKVEGNRYICSDGSMWRMSVEVSGGQLYRIQENRHNSAYNTRTAVGRLKDQKVAMENAVWCNPSSSSTFCAGTARFSVDGAAIEYPLASSRSSRGDDNYDIKFNATETCRLVR